MLFPNWEENEVGVSKEDFINFTDKLTEIQEEDKLFFFIEHYLPMLKELPSLQELEKTTSIYFEEKFRECVNCFHYKKGICLGPPLCMYDLTDNDTVKLLR